MIVFVLRHADRQPDPNDDLTPAGEQRAQDLSRMLAGSGISIAFCSEYRRARRTLEPLKQKLGVALTVKEIRVGGSGGPAEHVQKIVQAVRSRSAESVIAVVSHSNTVKPIIESLGGGQVEAIQDDEFDKLFLLFIDQVGKVTLLRLRYGAPT